MKEPLIIKPHGSAGPETYFLAKLKNILTNFLKEVRPFIQFPSQFPEKVSKM